MSNLMTLSQIRTEIRRDLNAWDTNWLTDPALNIKINDAISNAAFNIHTLYEDYFLDYMMLPLVQNIQMYSLPSNIYANKIRKVTYNDGTTKYIIKRVNKLEDTMFAVDGEPYMYNLLNYGTSTIDTAVTTYNTGTKQVTFTGNHFLDVNMKVEFFTSGGTTRGTDYVKSVVDANNIILKTGISAIIATDTCNKVGGTYMVFYPTINENSYNHVSIQYLRSPKTLTLDADVCDIPEFVKYVIAAAKYDIVMRDPQNPMAPLIKDHMERYKQDMVESLGNMVVDDDNFIKADLQFYDDFDTYWRF